MKDSVVVIVVVAIALLVATQCDARSVSDDDLVRRKRQGNNVRAHFLCARILIICLQGLQWECSVNVDDCCVQFNCTTNAIIDVTTFDCSLDRRSYDCKSNLANIILISSFSVER